jgi:hypothetical protein
MAFNLDNYETVEVRLEKFIADYEDFRISTELESFANDRFIVKAYLYRTFADSVPFATGYAEEKITDRGVNATSALENCETSAIGRALANAGYAAKGKRPSREEMVKVARVTNDKASEAIANAPLAINNTWDEFVGKEPTPEPVTLAQAAELVQQPLEKLSQYLHVHTAHARLRPELRTARPGQVLCVQMAHFHKHSNAHQSGIE